MPRTGNRPTLNKVTGSLQTATDQTYVDEKALAPGLNDAWSSVVKFDDNYYPPEYTMTGDIIYTLDATNAGTGNGRKDTIVGNGGTITFTITDFTIEDSSLTPSANVVTTVNGAKYTIIFVRVGSVSEVYLKANSLTGQTQLSEPGSFQASAGNTQVDLSWSAVQSATGYILQFHAGDSVWVDAPSYDGTSTNYTHTSLVNGTQYFYRVKATAPGYTDSAYSQTSATPSAGITQLTAPTLNTATPANAQVTLAFTNPNSGNEDDNLIQYKLNTEPTVWTNGVVLATSAISGIQTGLTNGLLYDFRIIARGSGAYSNSVPSNVLSATPVSGYTFLNTHSAILASSSDAVYFDFDTFYPKSGASELPFSLEFWAKTPASLDVNQNFGVFNGNGDIIINSAIATDGSVTAKIRNGGTNYITRITNPGLVLINSWVQIFVTYSGDYTDGIAALKLYVNETTTNTPSAAGSFTGIADLIVGADLRMSDIGLDDGYRVNYVRWYNKELSAAEIALTTATTNKPRDISSEAFFSNCLLECPFNNSLLSTVGSIDGTQVGTVTFDTDIPV